VKLQVQRRNRKQDMAYWNKRKSVQGKRPITKLGVIREKKEGKKVDVCQGGKKGTIPLNFHRPKAGYIGGKNPNN